MRDYAEAYGEFSMSQLARDVLRGSLTDGVNAAIECCDRWADRGRIALNWIDREFAEKAMTFEALRDQSARFANWLSSRGIGRGDVVGGLLPRIPELLVVAISTWRVGAIYQPLFTAFGERGRGRLLFRQIRRRASGRRRRGTLLCAARRLRLARPSWPASI